jgi:hypothetical protein
MPCLCHEPQTPQGRGQGGQYRSLLQPFACHRNPTHHLRETLPISAFCPITRQGLPLPHWC